MCRLAYLPYKSLFLKWLPDFLADMEKSNGGHGMGIASGKGMLKGLGVDVEECLNFAKSRKGLPAIWHTRWISSGGLSDDLCHPFPCGGGYLVHNGHWSEGAAAATYFEDISESDFSDTRLFAMLVDKLGFWDAACKYKPDGIWLYLRKGQIEVYAGSGDLFQHPDTGILASEPPVFKNDWKRIKTGFVYRGLTCFEYDDRPWTGKITHPRWKQHEVKAQPKELTPEEKTAAQLAGQREQALAELWKKEQPDPADSPRYLPLEKPDDEEMRRRIGFVPPETAAAEIELEWNDKDQCAEGAWSQAGE